MPKKLVYNATTGQQTEEELTLAEVAELSAMATASAAARAAADAAVTARTQAIATLKARAGTDPVAAALVTVLGL